MTEVKALPYHERKVLIQLMDNTEKDMRRG
jgi:hypothetical protein